MKYVDGGTLLHFLSFIGSVDSCEFILKHNAYPHAVNKVQFNTISHTSYMIL